jgi:hypothetical protein
MSTPIPAAGAKLPPALEDAASEGMVAARWDAAGERASLAPPRRSQPRSHTFDPQGEDRAIFDGPSIAVSTTSAIVPRVRPQPIEGIEHSGPFGGWPSLLEPQPDEDVDWRSAERFLARQARLEREQRAF